MIQSDLEITFNKKHYARVRKGSSVLLKNNIIYTLSERFEITFNSWNCKVAMDRRVNNDSILENESVFCLIFLVLYSLLDFRLTELRLNMRLVLYVLSCGALCVMGSLFFGVPDKSKSI